LYRYATKALFKIEESETQAIMHIDPNSEIAGQPSLTVRHFFRHIDGDSFGEASLQANFSVSLRRAKSIVEEFERLGLIERAESPRQEKWWKTT
jgi:hypothetical protein